MVHLRRPLVAKSCFLTMSNTAGFRGRSAADCSCFVLYCQVADDPDAVLSPLESRLALFAEGGDGLAVVFGADKDTQFFAGQLRGVFGGKIRGAA